MAAVEELARPWEWGVVCVQWGDEWAYYGGWYVSRLLQARVWPLDPTKYMYHAAVPETHETSILQPLVLGEGSSSGCGLLIERPPTPYLESQKCHISRRRDPSESEFGAVSWGWFMAVALDIFMDTRAVLQRIYAIFPCPQILESTT
jgi:hypothetical protein